VPGSEVRDQSLGTNETCRKKNEGKDGEGDREELDQAMSPPLPTKCVKGSVKINIGTGRGRRASVSWKSAMKTRELGIQFF
jgi:hypothetical protein